MTNATKPVLPTLNVDLLADIVTWAYEDHMDQPLTHPEWGSWNQGVWAEERRNGVCQTAYCMAGQTVLQAGYGLVYDDEDADEEIVSGVKYTVLSAEFCAPLIPSGRVTPKGIEMVPDPDVGSHRYIGDTARDVLGLSEGWSDNETNLFDGSNDIVQIVAMGMFFARRRGQALPIAPEIAAIVPRPITEKNWRKNGSFAVAYDGDEFLGYTVPTPTGPRPGHHGPI